MCKCNKDPRESFGQYMIEEHSTFFTFVQHQGETFLQGTVGTFKQYSVDTFKQHPVDSLSLQEEGSGKNTGQQVRVDREGDIIRARSQPWPH